MMELTADKFINDKEFKRLLREVGESNTTAAKVDHFLYQFLWLTGLRITAALGMEWGHITENYIIVPAELSKSGKAYTVQIGKRAQKLLNDWREANPYKISPYLINSQKGPMNRASAHKRLKAWLAKAGLRDSIHLHSFRHSYALNFLNLGLSLPLLKTNMGHGNIATTSTYLGFTEENLQKLKESM